MKLRTKLSNEECRTRLGSATEPGLALSWDAGSPGPVVGEFRGAAFRLHTTKYYNNSFAPFFLGELKSVENGTVLDGDFRMNTLVRLSMVFWLGLLVLFGVGAMIVPAEARPAFAAGRVWFYVGLAGLAVLGFGVVQLGKWLSRSQKGVILAFLKRTLEADEVPD